MVVCKFSFDDFSSLYEFVRIDTQIQMEVVRINQKNYNLLKDFAHNISKYRNKIYIVDPTKFMQSTTGSVVEEHYLMIMDFRWWKLIGPTHVRGGHQLNRSKAILYEKEEIENLASFLTSTLIITFILTLSHQFK